MDGNWVLLEPCTGNWKHGLRIHIVKVKHKFSRISSSSIFGVGWQKAIGRGLMEWSRVSLRDELEMYMFILLKNILGVYTPFWTWLIHVMFMKLFSILWLLVFICSLPAPSWYLLISLFKKIHEMETDIDNAILACMQVQ